MSLFNRIRTLLLICALIFAGSVALHTIHAQSSGYTPVSVNSPTNTSLKVTATPLELNNTTNMWSYKIDWKRTRNAQGSISIAEESSPTTKVLSLSPASQEGSQTVTLKPSTTYRVKFYSTTGYGGTLILSKKMTTLATSDEDPDLEDDVVNTDTSITGLQTQIASLLAQINELRARLAGGTPVTTSTSSSPAVVTTTVSTGTGSYDPAVDNRSTNTFYIAPKSQVKTGSKPAYFFVRIGKYGSQSSAISEFKNVPKGMNVTFYRLDKDRIDPSWYSGEKLPVDQYSYTGTSFPIFAYLKSVQPYPLAKWLGTYQRWLKPDENMARSQFGGPNIINDGTAILRSGEMGLLKVDTDTDFTAGPGTYTITAVESTNQGSDIAGQYNSSATKKEVTFSVVIGDQVAMCLSDLKTWPSPTAKNSKTLPDAFKLSGDPGRFNDACDPSIGANASGFPNFTDRKKPLLQDCVTKAQKQADALGVPMSCSIITEASGGYFRAGCIITGTGYEFQAAQLVGTGQVGTNQQYSQGSWRDVERTILQRQAEKVADRGYVYYDNDSNVWRAMNQTVADAPASCDKLLDVDVKSVNKEWNISIHAKSLTEGSVIPIEIVAHPSVKSVSLYLLKDYTNGSNAREWWNDEYAKLSSATSWSSWIGEKNAAQSPQRNLIGYPEYHPQVALTMQRVNLVNGKGTIQWTVPSKLEPYQEMGWNQGGQGGLQPAVQYSIRAIADNSIWSDSPSFTILSNTQSCNLLEGTACDSSKVTESVQSGSSGGYALWVNGRDLYRSFGVMGQGVAPLDVRITTADATYKTGDPHPSSSVPLPVPVTAGKPIQISGYMFNNSTKKVDIDLLNIGTPLCQSSVNQAYQVFHACEQEYYSKPIVTWSIARDIPSRIITDSLGYNTWFFNHIFTVPSDAIVPGKYVIRITDPDFLYSYAGQERGTAIFGFQGGVAFSPSFEVIGSSQPATGQTPTPTTPSTPTSATPVSNASGVDGFSSVCESTSTFWFRNNASAYNLYRNTTNNVSTAQKILSNISYMPGSSTGGYVDKPQRGTYFYWVENVGSTVKAPSAKNAIDGVPVMSCLF